MVTIFFILQFGLLVMTLICFTVCASSFISMGGFLIDRDFKTAGQMLASLMVATLLLVASVYLIMFLDATKRNLPEYQARIAEQQQEEAKQLSAPVNIQPWGCFPEKQCKESDSEAIALADSESIPEIGLNRVLVKRDSDGKKFAIMLSGARNVKKGEKVRVVTVTYWINAARAETLIIGR